ncbi:MAG: FAD-dependent monooxygenase, partial [Stellaceae bacterium]
VVIVGAGPVGLVAAIELRRQGLRPIVLDAKDGISWTSRATCISRRSLEILDRIGAGAAFDAKALPWSRARSFYRDRLAFRMQMPHAPGDRHAPFVNLQQFYTEKFLLDALQTLGGAAEVRWQSRVSGVRPGNDRVALTVAGPDGAYALRTDWLIAADGGRSTVRDEMGLPLAGTAYESRYLIADIEVEGIERPVERNVWFDPPSNPGSTVILHVQPDHIWRVDYQLREDEDADIALREENVRERLQAQLEMMGVGARWRLIWKGLYKALALSLEKYHHGRVLFAGDAAHLVPIFGVRGLNSGIDDAHNLGWKLALVIGGKAPESLLESYSHERRRATRENHEQAIKSTWFMSPPSAGFRLLRDAALSLATEHEWASALVNPRQSSAHSYDDSPIILPDRDPRDIGVKPGDSLPNLKLSASTIASVAAPHRYLHEVLPRSGFAVLLFIGASTDPDVLSELRRVAAGSRVPLALVLIGAEQHLPSRRGPASERRIADPDGSLWERFAAQQFPLYLVRPDEHVAARLPAIDPAALLIALEVALGKQTVAPAARPPRAADAQPSSPPVIGLGESGLERVFEAISRGADAVGEGGASHFLARLALMLSHEFGDAGRPLALIDEAKDSTFSDLRKLHAAGGAA